MVSQLVSKGYKRFARIDMSFFREKQRSVEAIFQIGFKGSDALNADCLEVTGSASEARKFRSVTRWGYYKASGLHYIRDVRFPPI